MDKSNYRIDRNVITQVPLTPDLEWMLQSNQVGASMIAEVLVKEQFIPVYSLALSILDDRETAQRVAKETLMNAIANTYRYRQEFGAQTWIFSIALKAARGQLPFLNMWRALEAAFKIPLVPAKEEAHLPQNEVEAELWLAVDGLRLQNRLPFLLQVVHKLPADQTARVLGTKEKVIKSRLEDAVRGLRQSLVDKGFSGEYTREESYLDVWARSLQRRWAVSPLSDSQQDQLISEIESRFGRKRNQKRKLNLLWEITLIGTAVLLVAGLARSTSLISPEPTSQPTPTAISRRIAGSGSSASVVPNAPRTWQYHSGDSGGEWDSPRHGFRALPDRFSLDIPAVISDTGSVAQMADGEHTGLLDLTGVLKFWGWDGDLGDILAYLQPDSKDVSLTSFKLTTYVRVNTDFKALLRWGGDPMTLSRLIFAGFPVIIERGVQTSPADGWKGRYEIVYAYDRDRSTVKFFNFSSPEGSGQSESFENLIEDWREFNYVYLVVYPQDKRPQLQRVLGDQIDVLANYKYSAEKALRETTSTSGLDQFFAWFNRGTNLSFMDDYEGAAQAFDQAYNIYKALPEGKRPWRMIWYQSRPYWAYYYSGRYQDVIRLADMTLSHADNADLKESYYWRGLAKKALGDVEGAIADLHLSGQTTPDLNSYLQQLDLIRQGG
jgi:DNA-directed RNA polymerase specialized sigma24 family protein